MKNIFLFILLTFTTQAFAKSIFDFKLIKSDGKELNFEKFKGKTLLVVNIATKCGYTPQLDGLESIYKKYEKKGFVVIGIPSNDFGGQTPEENKDVKKFCRLKYGASFPITNKIVVKGENKNPLYTYLVSKTNNKEIEWNFTKFLINKKGEIVKRFPSKVKPESSEITELIEKNL